MPKKISIGDQELNLKTIPETTHKAIIGGDEVIPFAGPDGTFYNITRDELFAQLGGFVSGFQGDLYIADIPSEDGMYLAAESGTYTNAGGIVVDLSDGITFIIKEGATFEDVVYPISVDETVNNLIQTSDWVVAQPATYTYDRNTGLLTQTGALDITIGSGNRLIVTSFSDLQVVAPGVSGANRSVLYIDFDTPASPTTNIVGTISVAKYQEMPTVPAGKSRIMVGISTLISGTEADLYCPELGIYENTGVYKKPFQVLKESLGGFSTSGYVLGNKNWTYDSTTGTLNYATAQAFINNSGIRQFLVSPEGDADILITNFKVVPDTAANGDQFIVYADIEVPRVSTKTTLKVAKILEAPPVPDGCVRALIGLSKKVNAAQIDFYSPILEIYQESGDSKKAIQLAIEATSGEGQNKEKVEQAWYNRYPDALSKCPKFVQKVLEQEEDVEILLLGDSIFAYQTEAVDSPGPPLNLPNGCRRQHVQWWLWDYLVKNKPLTNRWEVTPNVFTYVGSWVIFSNSSGKFNAPSWAGEFRSDVGTIQASNTANASVGFSWDLGDYEKLNWVYKKTLDGASDVVLSVAEGNGLIEVFNGSNWVEANGYTFSQQTDDRPQGEGYALHLSDQKLKMRRVATSGTVNLTLAKGASTSEYLYFWGTERWNGASIFITNVARGGRDIPLLRDNFLNDVVERKPDLVIFSLPMTNEYSRFASTGYDQILDHVHDFVWGDRPGFETTLSLKEQSNNWQDFECLIMLPHYRDDYFDGDKPLPYTLTGGLVVYDGDSTPYRTSQKVKSLINEKGDLKYIDMGDVFIAEAKNLGWTIQQASVGSAPDSQASFTGDGIHQNTFGSYVWGKVLGGVLGNL